MSSLQQAAPPAAVHHPSLAQHHAAAHTQQQQQQQHQAPAQKVFSFVSLPGINQKKRPRRKYDEVERLYHCSFPDCSKSYGTLNHLNAHICMQNHGPKRHPSEFKELRKMWRKQKREGSNSSEKSASSSKHKGSDASDAASPIMEAHVAATMSTNTNMTPSMIHQPLPPPPPMPSIAPPHHHHPHHHHQHPYTHTEPPPPHPWMATTMPQPNMPHHQPVPEFSPLNYP
ncbi:hypothetical protein BC940DRAFT_239335 [Gongronella butleri]|nr:hypothetical protein BC940DRAFT_239335 [Gongronella butleri]